jgi:hypothetical protein
MRKILSNKKLIIVILLILSILLIMCKPENNIDSGDSGDGGDDGSDIYPEGLFYINNDDEFTDSQSVNINLSEIFGATKMRLANNFNDINTSEWEDFTTTKEWELSFGDGVKEVFAQFKNDYDNSYFYSDSIKLDTIAPFGSFIINNDSPYTADVNVSLDLSLIEGTEEMRFANSEDGLPNATWQTYSQQLSWTLENGEGLKTVYGEFKDIAGNTYQTNDEITLDTTVPSGTFDINDGNSYTNSTNVTLNLTNITNSSEMRFGNTESERDSASWQSFSNSIPWTLSDGDELKTVYGEFKTSAGVTNLINDTITLDTTAPNTPTVSAVTPTNDPTPTWTWNEPANTDKYRYGYTEGDWITEEATQVSFTPPSDLSSGDYTLYVQAGDNAGNWSSSSGSFTIIIDLIPPAEVSDLDKVEQYGEVTISWTNPTDIDFEKIEFTYGNATEGTIDSFDITDGSESIDIDGLINIYDYTFELKTIDTLGNKSDGNTITGTSLGHAVIGTVIFPTGNLGDPGEDETIYLPLLTETEWQNIVVDGSSDEPGIYMLITITGAEVSSGEYDFAFYNVPAGDYGLNAFLDENGNGELDTNIFGAPTEPWGTYRPDRDMFSAPDWVDVNFNISDDIVVPYDLDSSGTIEDDEDFELE